MKTTSRYAVAPRGPKRLEIVRSLDWNDVTIRFDGRELGHLDRAALGAGVSYRLPDGSVLALRLEIGVRATKFLYITRNGHDVPGSAGDPAAIIHQVVFVIVAFALLQILFGAVVAANGRADAGTNAIALIGVVLLLLCVLMWRRSAVATILATVITCAEVLLLLVADRKVWDGESVVRIGVGMTLLGAFFFRAIEAVRRVRRTRLPVRRAS